MKEKFYFSSSDAMGLDLRTTYQYLPSPPTSGIPASTANYFFLPMLGGFGAGTLDYVGSLGLFWTSSGAPTSSIGNSAYRLYFMEGQIIVMDGYRAQSGLVLPFE